MREHIAIEESGVLERLIEILVEEMPEYKRMAVPRDVEGRRRLFRSLCNVRPPMPVSEEFLELEGRYLSGRLCEKKVTRIEELSPIETVGLSFCEEGASASGVGTCGGDCEVGSSERGKMEIYLWRGDITSLEVDAIVNAANSQLLGCFVPCHRCIDNAIHSAAGVSLRLECDRIMRQQGHEEPVGRAKITPAFALPCRFVIHTVGPYIAGEVTDQDRAALRSCYESCLLEAGKAGVKSLAFCCISTGEFHFPAEEAARIAVDTVREMAGQGTVEKVVFNVFSERDEAVYRTLLGERRL